MKAVVYLGSRDGNDPIFRENAYKVGNLLAQNGIEVIYGGARVGTMGELARGVMDAGGNLTGVFPKNFTGRPEYSEKGFDVALRPGGYEHYTYVETPSLDERIRVMENMADVCVLLPGSYGSMHEFFCFFESNELGTFRKPMALLNTDGYYTHLVEQIRTMQNAGFSDPDDLDSVILAPTPEALVEALRKL